MKNVSSLFIYTLDLIHIGPPISLNYSFSSGQVINKNIKLSTKSHLYFLVDSKYYFLLQKGINFGIRAQNFWTTTTCHVHYNSQMYILFKSFLWPRLTVNLSFISATSVLLFVSAQGSCYSGLYLVLWPKDLNINSDI